jgi:hypothetical protein
MAETDILTPEQKKALKDAMAQIPVIKAQIELAKKAGLDVSAQEKQLAELEKQVQLLHSVYVAPSTKTPR